MHSHVDVYSYVCLQWLIRFPKDNYCHHTRLSLSLLCSKQQYTHICDRQVHLYVHCLYTRVISAVSSVFPQLNRKGIYSVCTKYKIVSGDLLLVHVGRVKDGREVKLGSTFPTLCIS